jgi:hypothetical protein
MLLLALEAELHDERSELIPFGNKLTIEHLLPRSWKTEHWPLHPSDDTETATETRNRLIQTIGNLTLLRQSLNSSVSNGPYAAKQRAILRHSALNLNRRLSEWDGWDEGAIQKRADELFKVARKIWPGPSE